VDNLPWQSLLTFSGTDGVTISDMTGPDPLDPPTKPTFFRRRFAPLISAWAVALSIAGLIYWFEHAMPAFHEVVHPLYWIIATIMVFGTWRWVRMRSKPRRDRRESDRRHADRRHDTPDQPIGPPAA